MSAIVALRYLWAAPATGVGLLAAGACLLFGARARLTHGAVEVSGGRLAAVVRRLPPEMRFSAITLGHVILGLTPDVLDRVRRHEQVHVRQYERWGLLFFPLYAGASLVAWLGARHPYWHNHFELQARREAGEDGGEGRVEDEGGTGERDRLS
ncbi:MAG TPA: signal peptide prediction [Burkholderiaceae bacterium]|nr:signal peptide prediction [Burkholderiaceae bacterium]